MAKVFRIVCVGALVFGAAGCHHDDDSTELRYITGGGGGGGGEEDEGEDDGGDEEDPPTRFPPDDKGGGGDDSVCGYVTYTQGGWSTNCKGNNPGCLRDKYFSSLHYPYLELGCGAKRARFANTYAVQKALPAGGSPRPLNWDEAAVYTGGADDPKLATVIAGQALALKLNTSFSAVDEMVDQSLPPFPSLVIADKNSPCYGMTVAEVVDAVDKVLGGGDCGYDYHYVADLTPEDANLCATRINESFVGGKPHCSSWYTYSLDPSMPLGGADGEHRG